MVMRKRSITRSRATSIPKTISPMPQLYKKNDGDDLLWDILGMGENTSVAQDGKWTRIDAQKPGENQQYRLTYAYIGGPNQFTVELSVEGAEANAHDIEWLYVRTHSGGQIKFIKKDQAAHALFAMAEDDAYMFCQNDPCLECAFACKIGFTFFAYSASQGLIMDEGKISYSKTSKR